MGDGAKMSDFKVLMITQEDPFYVRIFFEEFFANYKPLGDIAGVVIAPTMAKKSSSSLARQMFDFYGPVDFLRMGTRYAWYKVCDKTSTYIPMKKSYSISHTCSRYNVPVMHRGNINSPEFLKEIEGMDIDLIVSVAASQIFKERLINLPKKGCINVHNSKLPKYRGMLPNFWQMFHGEKTIGTTVHRINVGVDDGDILIQKETSLIERETLDSVICRTKKISAELIIEAINGIKNDSLSPIPNPSEGATYFTFPTKKDAQEFRRKWYRLL